MKTGQHVVERVPSAVKLRTLRVSRGAKRDPSTRCVVRMTSFVGWSSGVDLAHGPSDCAVFFTVALLTGARDGHSRNARLLNRQAWLRVSGDVAVCAVGSRSAGHAMSGHRARDQQVIHFRCAQPPLQPDKYADELLDRTSS